MERRLDHEPDTIIELTKPTPGLWCYPTNPEHCCIYRVPERLRRVNPDAYTPQLLLIGPLHHSLKSQALESCGDITKTKLMGYVNMEEHKKIYLEKFAKRVEGETTIDEFRRMIEKVEVKIRESYSESTSWIESREFVEMILLDSVFMLEHLLRLVAYYQGSPTEKTGDLIVDDPCLRITVYEDLMLLENQLPYFILEKLFHPMFHNLILAYFGLAAGEIRDDSGFRHFTDLLRCVRVKTLGSEKPTKTKSRYCADLFRCVRRETDGPRESTKTKFKQFTDLFPYFRKKKDVSRKSTKDKNLKHMYNAEKLYSAGVEFMAEENELSIDVRFEDGCLKIPCLWVVDRLEMILRNIMALEQCHYPLNTYVCDYVMFLDFLIDTDKDVDLLIEKGIINNWIGKHNSVADMVNKLCLGIIQNESYYSDIASKVNAYYENHFNRSRAVLGRVYFGNLWTGTATVAAILLLVMTLIQTVASVIQVMQK